MTPTAELRFVEREIEMKPDPNPAIVSVDEKGFVIARKPYMVTIHILQQKWQQVIYEGKGGYTEFRYEWRDVPCVKEEA